MRYYIELNVYPFSQVLDEADTSLERECSTSQVGQNTLGWGLGFAGAYSSANPTLLPAHLIALGPLPADSDRAHLQEAESEAEELGAREAFSLRMWASHAAF